MSFRIIWEDWRHVANMLASRSFPVGLEFFGFVKDSIWQVRLEKYRAVSEMLQNLDSEWDTFLESGWQKF